MKKLEQFTLLNSEYPYLAGSKQGLDTSMRGFEDFHLIFKIIYNISIVSEGFKGLIKHLYAFAYTPGWYILICRSLP